MIQVRHLRLISNYVWSNGTSGASATSTTVTTSGTHTLTIFDSDNLTNTCSISLSSRQEYRQATCTQPTYTNWSSYIWRGSTSCSPYEEELSKGVCLSTDRLVYTCPPYPSINLTANGLSQSQWSSECSSRQMECYGASEGQTYGTCTYYAEMQVSTRSCSTCNAQGSWGAWQTTPIEQTTCSIVIDHRTTIGQ